MKWKCKEQEYLYIGTECHELARHTLIYKAGIATACAKFISTNYAKKNRLRHDDRLRQGAEGLEFSLRAFYHAEKVLYVNEYLITTDIIRILYQRRWMKRIHNICWTVFMS